MLLESCGRYLKRTESVSQKFMTILNKMWKIRNTKKLPQKQLYEFENAYFFVFPVRALAKKAAKRRPLEQEYARHLLFERLRGDTVQEVGDLLSRLPWGEPGLQDYVFKCLLKIAFTGKFTTVNVLAALLAQIKAFHPGLVARFMDALLEDIEEEAQFADFQMAQHRVLVMRCLGELYNHGLATP